MVNRSRGLFLRVDGDGVDAELSETQGELLADARGRLGVPEVVGARETVEVGAALGEELLLGGGSHGNDGGGSWLSHLRGDLAAG